MDHGQLQVPKTLNAEVKDMAKMLVLGSKGGKSNIIPARFTIQYRPVKTG